MISVSRYGSKRRYIFMRYQVIQKSNEYLKSNYVASVMFSMGSRFVKRKKGKSSKKDFVASSFAPGLRDMGLNLVTLSFPKDLETAFLETYFKQSIQLARISLFIAALFFAVFGILDAALVQEMKSTLWIIRYGFICPGVLILFLFSYSPQFKRYMQPAIAVGMMWTGIGITQMILIAPSPANYSYYAGLILVFMYGYSFVRLRFIWATLAGWVIVIFYEIAALTINTPIPVFINNNFFFISANIIGMFACYSIEYFARRDFFLVRLLELEQQKVKAANMELEAKVQERTAQLIQANKVLRLEMQERKRAEQELIHAHKMEAIGTLAGGIAHDFNNILTAVMGYAEIGLHKKNIDQKKLHYIFEQILQAGTRAKDLIKQILTFSRQRSQERIPVRAGIIIKEALKLLRATLPKNIQIREIIRTNRDIVHADPTQLHQIVMNLCTNAAYAMKETGGVLDIILDEYTCDAPLQAQLSDLDDGPYLEITVRDTGAGIDPSVMSRIFDPFFSTKIPGEGTGMGLSVVHGIVKSYGGKVFVWSEMGKGTTFRIILPRADSSVTEELDEKTAIPAGHEHILLVDDEKALVEVGYEMLEEMGYTVSIKTDAREALEVFRAHPEEFDLVITDKSMPHMTGFDLARELFRIRPDIPVILCSGFHDEADAEKAKSLGFRQILVKPLVMREMAETIRDVLGKQP